MKHTTIVYSVTFMGLWFEVDRNGHAASGSKSGVDVRSEIRTGIEYECSLGMGRAIDYRALWQIGEPDFSTSFGDVGKCLIQPGLNSVTGVKVTASKETPRQEPGWCVEKVAKIGLFENCCKTI